MLKRFILSLLLIPGLAFAAPDDCITHGEHESVRYVLIDRTDILDDTANLKLFLNGVKEAIPQGERVVVALSSDLTSNAKIILDLVNPKESIWESAMKIRAAQNKIKKCFASLDKLLIEDQNETKHSAILETIDYFAKLITNDKSVGGKRFYIFSDMVQNSKSISFWNQNEINTSESMKMAKKLDLIPELKGVDIYIAGAGTGVSDIKAKTLEKFWLEYFKSAGGNVSSYGPILDIN